MRLKAAQRHIETQIQQLERIEKKPHVKAARLGTNLDRYEQSAEAAAATQNPYEPCHYPTGSHTCRLCSSPWSPSQREQFLLDIRREIVSATTSQPVPAVRSNSSSLHTRSVRRSRPNRGHSSAHSSFLNLGQDYSVHEEESEWYPSSLTVTPAASLQHLDHSRSSILASSVDEEINSLLMECREARQRARVEIDRALDAIQSTSPASSRSSHGYFAIYFISF